MAQAHGWELTVQRPGFIWGAGRAAIGGMGRQAGPFYVLIGPATRLPLTHVDNCADCFVEATGNPAAIGQVFNVVDDDHIRVWRYAREHARGAGRRAVPIPVPYHLGLATTHLAAAVSRGLFGKKGRLPSILTPRRFEAQFKPLRFSNRRLREILRWSPPLGFAACLDRTYKAE
jgi:UDP-glucose 4-epimerase